MTDRIAIQKLGTEPPTRAIPMTVASIQRPRKYAASTPSAMPIGKVMASDNAASDIVTGSRSATAVSTGRFSTSELPNLPCPRLRNQDNSCCQIGRSRPSSRRIRSTAAGVASAPAITTAGSPGSRCIRMKDKTATSSRTGMDWMRRTEIVRNMSDPIRGLRLRAAVLLTLLFHPHVPEMNEIIRLEILDLGGVVTSHRAHVSDLDHVGLLQHALLAVGPGRDALLRIERCVERVIGRIENMIVLHMREGVEHHLPLLRPERRI